MSGGQDSSCLLPEALETARRAISSIVKERDVPAAFFLCLTWRFPQICSDPSLLSLLKEALIPLVSLEQFFELRESMRSSLFQDQKLSQALDGTCELDFAFASEKFFQRGERRSRHGVFFTSPALASWITSCAFDRLEGAAESVLDPACGAGTFLLAALPHLQQGVLYGVDRDPASAALARLLITLAISRQYKHGVQCHVAHFDSILTPLAEWESLLTSSGLPRRFDIVVGNPPYGLSRDQKIPQDELVPLKKLYSPISAGKLNKYMIFLWRSFELLRDHGVLSMIVPNSWLGISSAAKLREQFLRSGSLCDIFDLGSSAFGDPQVETVVTVLGKNRNNKKIAIHSLTQKSSFKIDSDTCLIHSEFQIPLRWDKESADLLDEIELRSYALGSEQSPFRSSIALQAYAKGKGAPPQTRAQVEAHCFHSSRKESDLHFPYLEGRDISRYNVSWSGSYLHYGPWLAEPQVLSRFEGPRIIIREILRPLPYLVVSAVVRECYLYNKSVLHILPCEAPVEEMLHALSCILNSKFASFWFSLRGRKTQRTLFPKIVNGDLARFPVPFALSRDYHSLSDLYMKRSRNQHEALDKEIDLAVYELFGLSKAEYAIIERATNG